MYRQEHLHVYSPPSPSSRAEREQFAVPYHKDRGLFLLVTPSRSGPLLVRDSHGEVIRTDSLQADSVMVVMSSGLSDWLLEGTREAEMFHASSHAVPALASHTEHRTILARMKVSLTNL